MSYLLGGPLAPIGWNIALVEAPHARAVAELASWYRSRNERVAIGWLQMPYPACLHALEPLEAPSSRTVAVDHGGRWTILLNNSLDGAGLAALAAMLGRRLDVIAISAAHRPLTLFGDALDEFQVYAPGGPPPINLVRSVMSRAADGEWVWSDSGAPLPFEEVGRYEAPEVADRLDRDVIAGYLARLGVAIDENAMFGRSALVAQMDEWERNTLTLDQARAQWGMF